MNKIIAFFAIALLLVSVFYTGPTAAQNSSNLKYAPNQVVVLVKESTFSDNEIENMLISISPVSIKNIEKSHNYDLEASTKNHGKRIFILEFEDYADPFSVSSVISKNELVIFAEPNYIGYAHMTPNDPLFPDQWGLSKMELPRAFDREIGNKDIVIAIIDTGIDLDHEDLETKILQGYDSYENDDEPEDDHGHGTRMAGVVAAATNNNMGIAGACPKCKLLPVRAGFNNNGVATFYAVDVFQALEYSVNNPANIEGIPKNRNKADVISMSFSFSYDSQYLELGVEDAYAENAVLVASAGNQNSDNPQYPAAYPEVIAVAATDRNDTKASFSNYGDWVDVAAPGVSIKTTNVGSGYTTTSGTSPSAAFVSGAVALIISRDVYTPDRENTISLDQMEIRQILIDSSDPVRGFPAIEGGRVNAYRAIEMVPY